MTLTASCQINIQLIFTLAPAKNLAGKKSYTLRKFPGRGKGKSFRVLNFGCCVKKRFSQGGTWHSHVKRDRVDWQKIKINPRKETSLGVAQTFGPYKETNRQPNKQWFKQH